MPSISLVWSVWFVSIISGIGPKKPDRPNEPNRPIVSRISCPSHPSRALHEHKRTASLPSHAPSKLAYFSLLEWHPCWSHCGRRARLQMIPPSSLVISQGWGQIDLPLRAAFSPAHPLARRDVPLTRARAFRFSHFALRGSSQAILHYTHRGSTF